MADPNKLSANHPSILYAHVRPESKAAAEALLANRGFGHMDVAVALQALTDEIDARGERIKVLEAALKPFAKAASSYDPPENDDGLNDWAGKIRLGNLRDARTALNPPVPASTGETK